MTHAYANFFTALDGACDILEGQELPQVVAKTDAKDRHRCDTPLLAAIKAGIQDPEAIRGIASKMTFNEIHQKDTVGKNAFAYADASILAVLNDAAWDTLKEAFQDDGQHSWGDWTDDGTVEIKDCCDSETDPCGNATDMVETVERWTPAPPPPPAAPKPRPLCKFYDTWGGCRNGDACRFSHAPVHQEDGGWKNVNAKQRNNYRRNGHRQHVHCYF